MTIAEDTLLKVQAILNRVYKNDSHSISSDLPPMSEKITTSGTTTYIACAPPGTVESAAAWQCKKIAVSGNDTRITWAGSGNFNQIATDLTVLTYA